MKRNLSRCLGNVAWLGAIAMALLMGYFIFNDDTDAEAGETFMIAVHPGDDTEQVCGQRFGGPIVGTASVNASWRDTLLCVDSEHRLLACTHRQGAAYDCSVSAVDVYLLNQVEDSALRAQLAMDLSRSCQTLWPESTLVGAVGLDMSQAQWPGLSSEAMCDVPGLSGSGHTLQIMPRRFGAPGRGLEGASEISFDNFRRAE